MEKQPKIVPAMKALIIKDNKFLVVHGAHGNSWELPGGKIEFGENPFDALRREVKEEIGVELEIGDFVGFCWSLKKEMHIMMSVFQCKAKSLDFDTSKNPSKEKIDEIKFVTKEEFLSDEYPVFHTNLKEIIKNLDI